jgi:hypothetical protein
MNFLFLIFFNVLNMNSNLETGKVTRLRAAVGTPRGPRGISSKPMIWRDLYIPEYRTPRSGTRRAG